MCKSCFNEIHFIEDSCEKCGKLIIYHSVEGEIEQGCSYCYKKSFYFNKSISCIEYTDISKKIILGLKYNSHTYLAKVIAKIMKDKLEIEDIKYDYIISVPLHRRRLSKRGFNQADKIAKYLSEFTQVPKVDCIYRKSYTRMLYSLNKKERSTELKDVFSTTKDIIHIENKNVLIVDDIFTTGSTTNEISKLLKLNGANNVFVVTFLTKSSDNYVPINRY